MSDCADTEPSFGVYQDDDGWWWSACRCGWKQGPFLWERDAGEDFTDHTDADL